ncbi:SAM-dependent methyltransferase, partial [Micromonospora sp. STR1s_6]|nr:SAM-dependent methyltransferase [Micromonospora tarensis]
YAQRRQVLREAEAARQAAAAQAAGAQPDGTGEMDRP